MAEVITYPLATPAGDSRLVGTLMNVPQANGEPNKNLTRNFTVSSIATLIGQGYVEVTKIISNAEWLALPTTGIVVIPGVTGKHIQVLTAYVNFIYSASSFFFSSDLVLTNSATSATLNSDTIQARVPQSFEDIDGNSTAITGLEACAPTTSGSLYFGTLSTATNLGGGTISITVRYALI